MTEQEKYVLIGKVASDLKKTVEEKSLYGVAICQVGETLQRLGQSLAEFTCKGLSEDQKRALDAPRIEQLMARYEALSKRAEDLRRRKAELGF
jgi:hypothetical protein